LNARSSARLLDAGAHVDQRDRHGDTALIGAASVPYPHLKVAAAETVGILLAHGASVDATNDLGESPLMWAAGAGNAEAIRLLLSAAANPALVDRTGHDALFYIRNARDRWAFDPARVARYDEAESVLLRR
jgi:ankyrin repeat protein